ncbi:MAG: hypothetical protein IPK70_14505, partial [Flavobacteriales bacterium]|nr:hypothetical protein [Flavobacteriales bacterium]
IARLQPDGTLDPTYAPEADGPVRCMALQADGSLIVGGDFTTINGQSCNRVARLTPNGDVDASFSVGAGPDGEVRAIAIQADQRILIKGNFLEVGGQSMMFLARLTSAGALDMTFSANAQIAVIRGPCMIQPGDRENPDYGYPLCQLEPRSIPISE